MSGNLSSTLREMRAYFERAVYHPRFWAIFLAMIMLFAIIGPFSTFERLSLPMRFLYWSATMLGSWFLAILTISVTVGLLHKIALPSLVPLLLGAALSAFPIAGYLNTVIHWFLPLPDQVGYFYQLAYALPISVTFGALVHFALSGNSDTEQDNQLTDTSNLLLDRLPVQKRGPVLHLSMQDHYVSVTTTKGTELVLMRMADAVAALAAQDGLQIHRSHWIAKSAISSTTRQNGQPVVTMSDGKEFPVSRSYIKAAKAAGVI